MKLNLFDPPANMTDFDGIPNQRQQWSDAISGWINGAIDIEKARYKDHPDAKVQFFNPVQTVPDGLSLDQDIVWNAFPRTLLLGLGGKGPAYKTSEQVFSLTAAVPGQPTSDPYFQNPPGTNAWDSLFYRPLDEYCEWRVDRDPKSNKIIRITFTSEPPEYWQALHGDELQDDNGNYAYPFTGDKSLLLDLYHRYVSKEITLESLACQQDYYSISQGQKVLIFRKGDYNPYNPWNTTKGIMHLSHPSNYIQAEIQLGADATVLRQKKGNAVVQADALVCCSGYGGSSRTSDPTIGASINALAHLGAWITIKNPIGLYMNDLNTEGFVKPNGEEIDPNEYFKVLRGSAKDRMIERAVFEVPAREGFTVGDLKIAGESIQWGAQVAEHINIRITGTAIAPGTFKNPMLPCASFCCIDAGSPLALTGAMKNGSMIPTGYSKAFLSEQGVFASAALPASAIVEKLSLQSDNYVELAGVLRHKHR